MIAVLTLGCCLLPGAFALESSPGIKVTPLLKTTTSWDGKPIVYPQGNAQVTAIKIEIAPGAETGWHLHPMPNFGYVLQGTLEVTLKDGRVKHLSAGDVLPEVVDTLHNGRNVGTDPVQLVAFYVGTVDQPIKVNEADLSR
jgi:quercetin dioxygenase-like cupin family protein